MASSVEIDCPCQSRPEESQSSGGEESQGCFVSIFVNCDAVIRGKCDVIGCGEEIDHWHAVLGSRVQTYEEWIYLGTDESQRHCAANCEVDR